MTLPTLLKKILPTAQILCHVTPDPFTPLRGPTSLSAGLGPSLASQRPPGTVARVQGPARSRAQHRPDPPTTWPDGIAGRGRRRRARAIHASARPRFRPPLGLWDPSSGQPPPPPAPPRRPSASPGRLRPAGPAPAGPAPQTQAASSGWSRPRRAPPPATSRLGGKRGEQTQTGEVASAPSGAPPSWGTAQQSPARAGPCLLLHPLPRVSDFSPFRVSAPQGGPPGLPQPPVWRGDWSISVPSDCTCHTRRSMYPQDCVAGGAQSRVRVDARTPRQERRIEGQRGTCVTWCEIVPMGGWGS